MKTRPIIIALALLIFSCYSCKKQEKEAGTAFASVSFLDPTGISNTTNLFYEGDPIGGSGIWGPGKINTLPGKGKFTFVDKATGATLLDTTLNIDINHPVVYHVVQPDPNVPLQLLQNNQEAELPVREGTIKIRMANFAKIALPKGKIKVVFNQLDWNTFEYVPVGTLDNVSKLTPDLFTEVKRGTMIDNDGNPATDYDYLLTFLDETGEPIVDGSGIPVSVSFSTANSIYTVYIVEDASAGGDPYVYTVTVFEN